MTLENGKHFINLKDVLNSDPKPNGKIGFEFGISPISVVPKELSKPARRADKHLTAMMSVGIFPANEIFTGETALVHDFNNSVFVNMFDSNGRDWFVHPRVLVHKDGKAEYANEFPLQDVQTAMKQGALHLVTGNCLFGTAGALVLDGSGRKFSLTDPVEVDEIKSKVTRLEINQNLHPYEVDTILRMSSFIANFNPALQIELDFHNPRLEYWMYGLTLYDKELMDAETLLAWFSEVDQRSIGMEKLLRKRMPEHIRMNVVNPLAPIEEFVIDAVRKKRPHI